MTYHEGLAKLESRAKAATVVLWAFIAMSVLTAGGEMLETSGMIDTVAGTDGLTLAVGLVYIAYTLVFVASIIGVGMWIHRAHANLHESGADGLEFTPGWAVGWYFIPFANLIKPFQAMRELWCASHATYDRFGSEAPAEVKAWWGAWIAGNILSSVSTRVIVMGQGDANSMMFGNALGAAGTVGVLVAAVLLQRIVAGVTAAQRGGITAAGVFA